MIYLVQQYYNKFFSWTQLALTAIGVLTCSITGIISFGILPVLLASGIVATSAFSLAASVPSITDLRTKPHAYKLRAFVGFCSVLYLGFLSIAAYGILALPLTLLSACYIAAKEYFASHPAMRAFVYTHDSLGIISVLWVSILAGGAFLSAAPLNQKLLWLLITTGSALVSVYLSVTQSPATPLIDPSRIHTPYFQNLSIQFLYTLLIHRKTFTFFQGDAEAVQALEQMNESGRFQLPHYLSIAATFLLSAHIMLCAFSLPFLYCASFGALAATVKTIRIRHDLAHPAKKEDASHQAQQEKDSYPPIRDVRAFPQPESQPRNSEELPTSAPVAVRPT